jgi:hypothetical protein
MAAAVRGPQDPAILVVTAMHHTLAAHALIAVKYSRSYVVCPWLSACTGQHAELDPGMHGVPEKPVEVIIRLRIH